MGHKAILNSGDDYQLNEESARLVYRSQGLYQETMALNKYQNHLSLITDFEKYCAVYRCMSCRKLHYGRKDFLRHCKTCKVVTRQTYLGGIFKAKETVFDKLAILVLTFPQTTVTFPITPALILNVYLTNKTYHKTPNNFPMKPDMCR